MLKQHDSLLCNKAGGTRTASITGACVALADALTSMQKKGQLKTNPMKGFVAAISVGIVAGEEAVCDLEYGRRFGRRNRYKYGDDGRRPHD